MSEIISGLSAISERYQAVFCDVWGVLHNGEKAYADAVEALMQFRLQKKYVVLVTNSPKTPEAVAGQLQKLDVADRAYDRIVTAGEALQFSLFGSKHKTAYFIGRVEDRVLLNDLPDGVKGDIAESDVDGADCILCAGPDYGNRDAPEDYEIELRKAADRKLEMYCANPDIVVDQGDRRIWCAGAIAEYYEKLGGRVYQFGKPFPPIYQLARQKLSQLSGRMMNGSEILFIGDGIDTDLKGAMLEDMDALFISGGLAAEETATNRQAGTGPDEAKLAKYLGRYDSAPLFTASMLRW